MNENMKTIRDELASARLQLEAVRKLAEDYARGDHSPGCGWEDCAACCGEDFLNAMNRAKEGK